MLQRSQIGLNRIIYPELDIESYLFLASELGLRKVELRNDLADRSIIDDLEPGRIRKIMEKYNIEILTINALQKFNLSARLRTARKELEKLIELGASIGCGAIVLCPNNDKADTRSREEMLRETVSVLKAFRPLFEKSGLSGYVEPLGFPESSLSSLLSAQEALKEAGGSCYKIVYDTFHHYLGPDNGEAIERQLDISSIGIVHVSGVELRLPKEQLRDEHRVLVTAADIMGNREQLSRLIRMGYRGNVCFEPFSPEVQRLSRGELLSAVDRCIELLTRDGERKGDALGNEAGR